jgi:hypothetical protein
MTSFSEAFAAARKEKGAGKTFRWPDKNGKLYTTDYASEKASSSPSSRPKARPTASAPTKSASTAPAKSARPKTRVDAVASAKAAPDKVAKGMLDNNIVKATGDKLAADRKKTSGAPPAEKKKELTFGQAFRQGRVLEKISGVIKKGGLSGSVKVPAKKK